MNKEFIPYEQALALKELGFDETCLAIENSDNKVFYGEFKSTHAYYKLHGQILFSQAFKWFREKYGLYSWITMELGNKSTFCWVLSGEHTSTQYAAHFHTYEEAEFECLKKIIEIVKK
jgi:hypothetical protein